MATWADAAVGFCAGFAAKEAGNGTATRLVVGFGAPLVVCSCPCAAPEDAFAADIVGFDSTGGGGAAEESDTGPGVADISCG